MSIIAIDTLTDDFYKTISFKNSVTPDVTTLHSIFHGAGLMVNNTAQEAVLYTAESFVQDIESRIALGEIAQFTQREIYSRTELFGKVAQRISVYEYSFYDYEQDRNPRGINFIQYVKIGENWNITSMVWNDENEDYQIPEDYLAGKM
ncbi:hypothetical protein ACFS5N_07130 [Mucilaginibacter ximonensis]|uniref:DUF4440 domain-containing protein n=1 Tax=Mucilaginibacter ximonensis TaxID=538021 RepID=A0ABW5YA78_9SPHI